MGPALKFLIPGVIVLIAAGVFIFNTFKSSDQTQKSTPKPTTTTSNQAPQTETKTEYIPEKGFKEINVTLNEMNRSGTRGSAKITKVLNQTLVAINLSGKLDPVNYPANISKGTCANLVDSIYQLSRVKNGVSETALEEDFEELLKQKPLSLVVEKIGNKSLDTIACGDIN